MRIVDVDPLEQLVTLQVRVERWKDDQLIAEEERTLRARKYFKNELLMMLEQAGFDDIRVHGGFTEAEATHEDEVLVFVARK